MNQRILYRRIILAGIREDMANRIMYSILPHVADPAHAQMAGGFVDYKALRKAIAGAKNIIKYSLEAIEEELENYGLPEAGGKRNRVKAKKAAEYSSLRDSGQIEKALETAQAIFNDDGWDEDYGGKAWGDITRCVKNMFILDSNLTRARESGDKDKEIQLMKNLIVELNIFDGLSHNTDSVLSNMNDIEMKGSGILDTTDEPVSMMDAEYQKIKKLMNSKELHDPIDVYKMVQPTLEDSGDIHQYKDWNTKLRNTPGYHKRNQETALDLYKIELKKTMMGTRGQMNKIRDALDEEFEMLSEHPADDDLFNAKKQCANFNAIAKRLQMNFKIVWTDFEANYSELDNVAAAKAHHERSLAGALRLSKQYQDAFASMASVKTNEQMITFIDRVKPIMNSLSFYIDSLI